MQHLHHAAVPKSLIEQDRIFGTSVRLNTLIDCLTMPQGTGKEKMDYGYCKGTEKEFSQHRNLYSLKAEHSIYRNSRPIFNMRWFSFDLSLFTNQTSPGATRSAAGLYAS